MTGFAPRIAVDRADAAELARVLGITEFLTTRPAARASLTRFAYPHCPNPYFWTDELLDYLHQTTADLHHLTHSPARETP
jgi:hypothetical protein